MHGVQSQPEKQLGISPASECRPSGPASGSSESLSLLTCPTGNDVTGLYPSGQGRSQQKRADVAAVLQGWLEADASSVGLQQT